MSSGEGSSIISELTELIVVANQGNSSFVVQTNSVPALYIDNDARIGVNTLNPGAQFEVASATGSCVRLRYAETSHFADLQVDSNGNLAINAGSNKNISTNSSFNVANHNGNNLGLKLAGQLVQASATELNYTMVTPGTAAASKAVVLDSAKGVSGIESISASSIAGTLQTAAQPNITSVGVLSNLNVANDVFAQRLSGVIQTAAQPNITSVGTLSSLQVSNGVVASQLTGTLQTASQPNITSVGNLSSVSISGSTIGSEAAFLAGALAGTAANSKVLVLSSTGSITGIGSLSASQLTGTLQTASQPNITSVGTLGSLTVTNGVSASTLTGTLQTASQPNITSVGNLSSVSIAGNVISGTEAGFLAGATAGTAADSKVLVLGPSGSISGITALTATRLTGTLQTGAQPNITSVGSLASISIGGSTISGEAAFLAGATAGVAANSKALVLSSSGSITGINSLSATSVSGTLQTSAQPNITSVGTLGSLTVSGSASFTSTTDATSLSNASAVFNGGVGVAKSLYVGTGIYGAIQTASQPNITYLGTLSELNVNGVVNVTGALMVNGVSVSGGGGGGGSVPSYISGVTPGTASAGKVLVLDSSSSVSGIDTISASTLVGTLQTAAQPNITSVGNLSSISIAGSTIGSEAAFLSGASAGTAAAGKVLVVDSNRSIGNINTINATSLNVTSGITVNGQPLSAESVYTTSIVPGTVSASKAVVVDANKDITGYRNVTASQAYNVLTSVPDYTVTVTQGATSWSYVTVPAGSSQSSWSKICWSPELGLFVAVAATGTHKIATSADGTDWTIRTVTGGSGSPYTGVCWSPELGIFVVCGNGSLTDSIATSSDGITWTARTVPIVKNYTSVIWSKELSKFVVVSSSAGTDNVVLNSSDGITWTSYALGSSNLTQWNSVIWSAEKEIFVAVGLSSTHPTMTSTDGMTWSLSASAPKNVGWTVVVWAKEVGRFVAVSTAGNTTNAVMTSDNGIDWITRTVPIAQVWRGLVWAPEASLFVATGFSQSTGAGDVITSTNGIDWVSRTGLNGVWRGVAWSPELGLYVVVSPGTGAGTTNQFMKSLHVFGTKNITYSEKFSTGNLTYSMSSSTASCFNFIKNNLSILKVSDAGITMGSTTLNEAEFKYIDGITPGSSSVSKALVVDSNKNISGIGSLSASQLTGTLQTASQPNITSVGTLDSLAVTNGISASTLLGTLQTASQPNVTSVGTLSQLDVNGVLEVTGSILLNGVELTSGGGGSGGGDSPAYVLGITPGVAAPNKALVLDENSSIMGITSLSSTNLSGTLQTASQPNITSVGTLGSLTVTNKTSTGYIQATRDYLANGTDVAASFIGSLPYSTMNYFGIGAHNDTDASLRIGLCDDAGSWTTTYPSVYSGSFTSISDYRIKENVQPIPYGLEEVKKLNPVKYQIKGKDEVQIGFIAHEVQAVVPEVVHGSKDEVDASGNPVHQGVLYANLTALLIKAVQEQAEQIEMLKQEIANLKK